MDWLVADFNTSNHDLDESYLKGYVKSCDKWRNNFRFDQNGVKTELHCN